MDFEWLQQIIDDPNSTPEDRAKARAQMAQMSVASGLNMPPGAIAQPLQPEPSNRLAAVLGRVGGNPAQAETFAPPAQDINSRPVTFARPPQQMPQQAPEETEQPLPQPQQTGMSIDMPDVGYGPVERELAASRRESREAGEAKGQEADELRNAAMAEEAAAKEQADIYANMERDVRDLQESRRQMLEDAQSRLQSFSDEYTAAVMQGASPDAALVARETRDAVISNIVMGMGALAQLITGGNTNGLAGIAEGIMNRATKAIDRDIQKKFNRIDALGRATTMAERQIQAIRQTFDDDKAAREYLTQVEINARVKPKLAAAAKSSNMATAAAAQAQGAVFEAQEARARAGIEQSLIQGKQRRADMKIAMQKQAMAEAQKVPDAFEVSEGMGATAKQEVRKDFDNLSTFAKDAKRLAELNRKVGRFAKLGDWAAYIKGGGSVKEARELNSLVIRLFKANTNLGQALTPTEIQFGMSSLGSPLSFFTDADALDSVLQSTFHGKVNDFRNRSGVRLTDYGRAHLLKTLRDFGGSGPAPRNPAPAATR